MYGYRSPKQNRDNNREEKRPSGADEGVGKEASRPHVTGRYEGDYWGAV